MKRSPLRRLTPLRRVGWTRKRKPLPPDEQAVLSDFAAEFKTCWRCGTGDSEWNPLDTHHISQKRRWHVRENLARLCRRCHDLFHFGQGFTLADVIELKRLRDPLGYDAGALLELLRPGRR